jgi:hypothetical protein
MGQRRTERWGLQLRAWGAPGNLHHTRREYAALRDAHNNDPRGVSSDDAANLAANNPLMAEKDSPWAKYFRNQEVRDGGERRGRGGQGIVLLHTHFTLL